MPTSSLLSIAQLFGRRGLKGVAGALLVPLPTSARQLIERASLSFLAGWELAAPDAIAVDERAAAWHTGHVEDVFPVDARRVFVASESGGVWLASTTEAFDPLPLSNGWRDVNMHCLGAGSRSPQHIYAGGLSALYETAANSLRALANFDRTASVKQIAIKRGQAFPVSVRKLMQLGADAPLFDWRKIPILDTSGDPIPLNIWKLAVVTELQPAKLVLATDKGVWWSDVPAFGQNYAFAPASGIPSAQCLAVALSSRTPGQNRFVVCSPTGAPSTPQSNGLYVGSWQGGALNMQRASHAGDIDFVQWQYAVVASSASNRSMLYAAVSASGTARLSLKDAFRKAMKTPPFTVTKLAALVGAPLPSPLSAIIRRVNPPRAHDTIYAVLSSSDGGANWSPVGPNQRVDESIQLPRDPGQTQEGYNLSIAVSHADSNTVALGWRIGPWIGKKTPQAFLWEEHGDVTSRPGFSAHIHSDSHGLHFDPHDPQGKTLLVCSDGGVIYTRDLCATFVSAINRRLSVLQFESYPANPGGFAGSSGVSPHTPGLVAGALKDNGLVFTSRDRPWTSIIGGDGFVSVLLEHDNLLHWSNDDPPSARIAKWNGAGLDAVVPVLVRTPSSTLAQGQALLSPVGEPVFRPTFKRPGTNQPMYAVAACDAAGTAGELWGLFADPDGGNPVWDFLAPINAVLNGSVTAIASDDGATVLVGTARGRIFSYDSPSGALTADTIDPAIAAAVGQVYQFSFLGGGVALARCQVGLLRFDPPRNLWTAVGGNGLPINEGTLQFTAVDTGRTPRILYAATDYAVHATWDAGDNWLPVSRGLPVRAHLSTLRFVAEPDQSRHLYLFTYGRSAWKARLH
jgi:hypothetical protein